MIGDHDVQTRFDPVTEIHTTHFIYPCGCLRVIIDGKRAFITRETYCEVDRRGRRDKIESFDFSKASDMV